MVTGDGANLSQGQRQLWPLPGAAVADPPVMILDEATSSIDTRTESLIAPGWTGSMEGRTVFVNCSPPLHRAQCRRILVLEHGEDAEGERASTRSFWSRRDVYYQLYTTCSSSPELSPRTGQSGGGDRNGPRPLFSFSVRKCVRFRLFLPARHGILGS